jgi:hypothetical protein
MVVQLRIYLSGRKAMYFIYQNFSCFSELTDKERVERLIDTDALGCLEKKIRERIQE